MRSYLKALSAILSPMVLAGVLTLGMYAPSLLEAHSEAAHGTVTNPLGGPLSNLPVCTDETGAGYSLCVWDASSNGNGDGTTIVSGDCAPDYVGKDNMQLCITVHDANPVNAQNCNDEFVDSPVELKKCYARMANS